VGGQRHAPAALGPGKNTYPQTSVKFHPIEGH